MKALDDTQKNQLQDAAKQLETVAGIVHDLFMEADEGSELEQALAALDDALDDAQDNLTAVLDLGDIDDEQD